jgi:hypothetical protein
VFGAFQKLQGLIPDVVVGVMASFQVKNKKDIAGIIGARGKSLG